LIEGSQGREDRIWAYQAERLEWRRPWKRGSKLQRIKKEW